MNKIEFPIGDWSDDGHGKCDTYLVTTPMSVQEVREAHFAASSALGFDIGDICCDYHQSEIDESILEKISSVLPAWDNERMENTEALFILWISLLNLIDPRLMLTPIESDAEPINFYGHDDQGRHLNTPGYGLFE
jgi:hypothetical protein